MPGLLRKMLFPPISRQMAVMQCGTGLQGVSGRL